MHQKRIPNEGLVTMVQKKEFAWIVFTLVLVGGIFSILPFSESTGLVSGISAGQKSYAVTAHNTGGILKYTIIGLPGAILATTPSTGVGGSITPLSFSPTQNIAYGSISSPSNGDQIELVDTKTKTIKKILPIHFPGTASNGMTLSHNGQYLLVSFIDPASTQTIYYQLNLQTETIMWYRIVYQSQFIPGIYSGDDSIVYIRNGAGNGTVEAVHSSNGTTVATVNIPTMSWEKMAARNNGFTYADPLNPNLVTVVTLSPITSTSIPTFSGTTINNTQSSFNGDYFAVNEVPLVSGVALTIFSGINTCAPTFPTFTGTVSPGTMIFAPTSDKLYFYADETITGNKTRFLFEINPANCQILTTHTIASNYTPQGRQEITTDGRFYVSYQGTKLHVVDLTTFQTTTTDVGVNITTMDVGMAHP